MPKLLPGEKMIELKECRQGYLYKLRARNIVYGVYCAADKAFYGIRNKFNMRFIDHEFHWDTGVPFGTALPIEELKKCPYEPNTLVNKNRLFSWLDRTERSVWDRTVSRIKRMWTNSDY